MEGVIKSEQTGMEFLQYITDPKTPVASWRTYGGSKLYTHPFLLGMVKSSDSYILLINTDVKTYCSYFQMYNMSRMVQYPIIYTGIHRATYVLIYVTI